MTIYVLVQVDEGLHETEGCDCGCGEGWETNYQTHCAVIKVSTNREKLEAIKLDAESQNQKITEYNQKLMDEYKALVQAENIRVNKLYSEQLVRYRELFVEYKDTVNSGLNAVGKELFNKQKDLDWFTGKYHDEQFNTVYINYQVEEIIYEFFKRFPVMKLNDKDLKDLTERDLKGYQMFEKTQFQMPIMKSYIVPYQIIEKELED